MPCAHLRSVEIVCRRVVRAAEIEPAVPAVDGANLGVVIRLAHEACTDADDVAITRHLVDEVDLVEMNP